MKHRFPEGCSAVSHAGKQLAIASDGTIDLDPATVADLLPHGIERVTEGTAPATAADGKTAGASDRRMLR